LFRSPPSSLDPSPPSRGARDASSRPFAAERGGVARWPGPRAGRPAEGRLGWSDCVAQASPAHRARSPGPDSAALSRARPLSTRRPGAPPSDPTGVEVGCASAHRARVWCAEAHPTHPSIRRSWLSWSMAANGRWVERLGASLPGALKESARRVGSGTRPVRRSPEPRPSPVPFDRRAQAGPRPGGPETFPTLPRRSGDEERRTEKTRPTSAPSRTQPGSGALKRTLRSVSVRSRHDPETLPTMLR